MVETYRIASKIWQIEFDESWGSEFLIFDFIIQSIKKFFGIFGIKKYIKNGYTIVLKKV